MIVIVKIGTSSITDDGGEIVHASIAKLCGEVAAVRALGHHVVVVSSGAIGAGLPALGLGGARRPRDAVTLQHPEVGGLYPCGEGAGFAGGIVSAALDGMRCAEAFARAAGLAVETDAAGVGGAE